MAAWQTNNNRNANCAKPFSCVRTDHRALPENMVVQCEGLGDVVITDAVSLDVGSGIGIDRVQGERAHGATNH